MILPEQQRFYDYWRSKCKGGVFPTRHDILPEDIVGQLTMTSLLDIEPGECDQNSDRRFKYRLAGTGFWNLYMDEIQGQYIDELPLGDRCAYWDRVLGQVVDKRRPFAGVTRPGTPQGNHFAQFWIRLPLSDNGTDINVILGYDHLVKLSELPAMQPAKVQKYA
ncbi:PAS domain-containing protein [Hellea sp.]|nr:PAS domain-containing protein [Hellea sp.]